MRTKVAESTREKARAPFGSHAEKDWFGRSDEWNDIFGHVIPHRKMGWDAEEKEGGDIDWLDPPRIDETVSVTTSWHHMSAFGFLQRMLCIVLQNLTHLQLQMFYFCLRCFDEQRLFVGLAPRTRDENFFLSRDSVTFSRRLSKMTETYARLFVAASALEVVMGFQHEPTKLFRDWVGMSTAVWFDVDGKFGAPGRESWNEGMCRLLNRSV